MKKIAIINMKGGSGKSTLAALVVRALSAQGMRVLAADLDPQAGLTAFLHGEPEGPAMVDLLMGKRVDPLHLGGFDLLQSDERLDAIYSDVQPFALEKAFRGFDYEYMVFDTPPTTRGVTQAAALYSDLIITPADISPGARRTTLYTLRTLRDLKKTARVYLIGREPKPDARGFTAELTRGFIKDLGPAFKGFMPKSITAQKIATGQAKAARLDYILDMVK